MASASVLLALTTALTALSSLSRTTARATGFAQKANVPVTRVSWEATAQRSSAQICAWAMGIALGECVTASQDLQDLTALQAHV